MPLRIIHGVDADSGPRLARALRRLIASDDSLNVSTAEGLRSLARALDAVEARSMGILQGPLTMAQIAIAVALGYLDFRHADRDWRRERPALSAWEKAFALRPAMVETRPK